MFKKYNGIILVAICLLILYIISQYIKQQINNNTYDNNAVIIQ